jgi:DNA repair protein RecN (Recombination protein N)
VLTGLRLENIALVESLELEFSSGFTVLTGETGAGKSLLLDALDALLGGGSGARLLRQGTQRGLIEALFTPTAPVLAWLQRQQLDQQLAAGDAADTGTGTDRDAAAAQGSPPELVLSREWRSNGERIQSRSRINGVVVNRQQLLELRPLLLDLTVQGQSQDLARPGQQRQWLDRCGGDALAACLGPVRQAVRSWRQAATRLEQARADRDRLERERQEGRQQLEALEAAALEDPNERLRLQQDQDRLAHAVRLQEGVMLLLGRLVEGADNAPAALDHLAACEQELQQLAGFDASLGPLLERCGGALQDVQELARDLERYGGDLDSDPVSLEAVQERLALLKGLERRHGRDLAGLIEQRDQLREQLSAGAAAALEALEAEEQQTRLQRDQACSLLSAQRQQAARQLEEQLTASLRPMGLADVRFSVAVVPAPPAEEGADAVAFLFSANPGQPLAPLREVASGGEMSRFLLALKTCLAAADPGVTLLFDEIDSGVSGRVSGAIAELLRQLAAQRQVFCVTHQPLVAAAADHHFQVSKAVEAGRTLTRVHPLRDTEARQQELAELAGGDFSEAHRYAAGLLERG